jgi:hypothetical protein
MRQDAKTASYNNAGEESKQMVFCGRGEGLRQEFKPIPSVQSRHLLTHDLADNPHAALQVSG